MDVIPADDDRDWLDKDLHNRRENCSSFALSLIGKLSYHLFGSAQSSNFKYNRDMIEALNRVVGEMDEDIADMDKRVHTTLEVYTQLAKDLSILTEDMHTQSNRTRRRLATYATYYTPWGSGVGAPDGAPW